MDQDLLDEHRGLGDFQAYPDVAFHPDPRPGHYFVTAVNGEGRYASLLGPLSTHQEALQHVRIVQDYAITLQPSATWYRFGTCRLDHSASPETLSAWQGRFNDVWPLEYVPGTQVVRPAATAPAAAPRHVLAMDVNQLDKLPPDYRAHDGQAVSVIGPWPNGTGERRASQSIRVRAEDGWEGEVLIAELQPTPQRQRERG